MTKFDVLDETGSQDELRERVVDILARVAPLVKTTTGLDLPDRVTFRIVSVKTARSAMSGHMAHLFRTYRELVPRWKRPLIALASIPLLGYTRWRSAARCEFLVMGATYTVPRTEKSETLFVPQALGHTGILPDDKNLTSVVIHELVHQLQNWKSQNRTNWIKNKAMTLLHGGASTSWRKAMPIGRTRSLPRRCTAPRLTSAAHRNPMSTRSANASEKSTCTG
ncbi:hypothetical protein ACIBUR_29125 [Streptomyces anulatus]